MSESTVIRAQRIKVFIDYWNFQLLINQAQNEDKVSLDWQNLGNWLAIKSAEIARVNHFSYEGTNIYTSYNPKKEKESYYKWAQNWLNRQAGIQVYCLERKPSQPPDCPTCHKSIATCPHCAAPMIGTIEKGVDALIVTDMIRLAWEDAYDIAVLASSDRDLIPGVKYLDIKGKKVVQAGFPPIGSDLAKACWASFDIKPEIKNILRKKPS